MRYFKLLKDIFAVKVGTIIEFVVNDPNAVARIGTFWDGFDIPLFIVLRNPEWFEEVTK